MAIVQCPKCGAKNRVQQRAGMQAVCGKCGAKIEAVEAGVVEVTDGNFARLIANAGERPVLVDCWAAWCGPCRMIAPTIEQIADEAAGRWVIGKLNVDENPGVAQQYQVSSIPTMLIFMQGQLVDQIVGLQPKQAIVGRLERAASAVAHR